MSREPDRDDLENAADDVFDVLEGAETVAGSDDELEASIDQDTPTAGGDEIDGGTTLEFDEDDVDEADARVACRFCETEFNTRVAERRHHSEDRCEQGSPAFHPDGRIDPQVHELRVNWLFEPLEDDLHPNQDGLAPFFAMVSQWDRCLKNDDGYDDVGAFDGAGDTWVLNHEENKINYRDEEAKIKTRPEDSGESYNEYVIGVVATGDDVRERKISFQFRPSLPNAKHCETDERIKSMPADLPLGIRIEAQSSNVELEEQLEVLRALMDALDIDTRYFKDDCVHEYSTVWGLGLYVRAKRELAEEKFVETGGVMDRLEQFSSVRRGRGEYKWNNEKQKGHRHAVAMNETALEKLYGDHEVGKLLKYYLPKKPPEDPNNPLHHPKIEVQFNSSYSDYLGGGSVPVDSDDEFDYQDMKRELDEFLIFGLNAAELPLRADPSTYVADEYWDITESDRDVTVHADPTEELREAEEDLTRAQFARDDLTPTDRAVIEALTDGGAQHYQQIAEQADASSSSVYRAIDKWGSLVTKVSHGTYDLADDVVREKIEDVFTALEDVTEWVERGIDAIVESSEEIAGDSPFAKWARRHGAVFSEHYDELEVELTGSFSDKYELRKLLRSGLQAAEDTGAKTRARFVDGTFTFRLSGQRRPEQTPFHYVGDRLFCLGARTER